MGIQSAISTLKNELPQDVKLVAVSKFKPVEDIMEAYACGQRAFGENRPQELASKAKALPSDIEWHFIGHLQTNKIKFVLPYASLIQSVDSERLLAAINSAAAASGKAVSCLLEVHIASEESKQGFSPEEVLELSRRFEDFPHVHLRGVMGMASLTEDREKIRREFRSLKQLSDAVRVSRPDFDQISMGMSGDWRLAVEEGATIVRIGSTIFGARQMN